jgi:hypothetical protein
MKSRRLIRAHDEFIEKVTTFNNSERRKELDQQLVYQVPLVPCPVDACLNA